MSLVPFSMPSVIPVDPVEKFVIFFSGATHTNLAGVIAEYNNIAAEPDSDAIEGLYSVPAIGMESVEITYANATTYLTETINVDTTSSVSFWADIEGWLFANNFFDITFVAGAPDKYKINDPGNHSYIILFF